MFRSGLIGLIAFFAAIGAQADVPEERADCDLSCMFEEIWQEMAALSDKDRDRLVPNFLGALSVSEDEDLIERWEKRVDAPAEPLEPYENYALTKVERFISSDGWAAFFSRARLRAHPFNSGRPEMMAAAAEHLADEPTRRKILEQMESFARADLSEAAFERAAFGHVLADAYMRGCNLDGFDRALELTDAPDALRYAFWRTRITGQPGDLTWRLQQAPEGQQVMVLRQALDGLADVLSLGDCAAR